MVLDQHVRLGKTSEFCMQGQPKLPPGKREELLQQLLAIGWPEDAASQSVDQQLGLVSKTERNLSATPVHLEVTPEVVGPN